MSKKLSVRPSVTRLDNFLSNIEEGKYVVPTFQRDFVWKKKHKIELFDSISREFPIGTILLWKPDNEFKYTDVIGPFKFHNLKNVDHQYILDGFQRITTLLGCLLNPSKTALEVNSSNLKSNFTIYYDLALQEFTTRKHKNEIHKIRLYKLIDTYEFLDYIDELRTKTSTPDETKIYIERAKALSSTLIDYSIPSIEINGGTIKEAVEIFSRVNSKGVEISPDWMLSALTADENNNFNLGDILGELLTDLEEFNFGDLKREILVQCIQNSFGKAYFDQPLESLIDRKDFKDVTVRAIESIREAVKFLYEELLVVDRKLLPYNYQLVFLSYYFLFNERSQLNSNKLKEWFWFTSYTNYFTVYSLSKIREAFANFRLFTEGNKNNAIYTSNEDSMEIGQLPKNVSFGSVRSKTYLLFLLNYSNEFHPISTNDVTGFDLIYLDRANKDHNSALIKLEFKNNDINIKKINRKDIKDRLHNIYNNNSFDQYLLSDFLEHLNLRTKDGKLNFGRGLDLRQGKIEEAEITFVEELENKIDITLLYQF